MKLQSKYAEYARAIPNMNKLFLKNSYKTQIFNKKSIIFFFFFALKILKEEKKITKKIREKLL